MLPAILSRPRRQAPLERGDLVMTPWGKVAVVTRLIGPEWVEIFYVTGRHALDRRPPGILMLVSGIASRAGLR